MQRRRGFVGAVQGWVRPEIFFRSLQVRRPPGIAIQNGESSRKDLFDFGWTGTSTWSRKYSIGGTVRPMPFTKCVQMMAISTSCAGRHPRRMAFGIWNHSGNCHAKVDLENGRTMVLRVEE